MAATSVLLLLVTLLPPQGLKAHQDSGIVNGEKTKTNSKPYMVSVQERNKETEKSEHICGGFLVSDNFVMTAAHCYKGNCGVNLMVVVGAHDISRQESSARRIDLFQNDIMLLQLAKTMPKSKSVQQIPLPKKDKDIMAKFYCTVCSWVNVTVIDRASCQRSWGNTATITPSMICAGDTAADYKGVWRFRRPLVCKGTAVRVVSFNEKGNCDNPKEPNVYTKISKYLSWIKCIIKY
uniref:Peptidase S1 domain-containing protein n=1 Tax=Salmo trutta TaxID=8032 RepID=A0A673XM07_SALTR